MTGAWRATVAHLLQRAVGGRDERPDPASEIECLAAQIIWWDPPPLHRPA